MRIALGQIVHETNVFNPLSTTIEQFKERDLFFDEAVIDRYRNSSWVLGGMINYLEEKMNAVIVPTIAAMATPSGMVEKDAYEFLKKELLKRLADKRPLDGVLLSLHGAMVVSNNFDPEGDLVSAIKELLGKDIPIVVVVDFHANLSRRMINNVDCCVVYRTYPHIDTYDRGREAAEIIINIIKGDFKPTFSFIKLPMAIPGSFFKTREYPTSKLMSFLEEIVMDDNKVINASIAVGFIHSDVPDATFSVLVTSNANKKIALKWSQKIARKAWNMRQDFLKDLISPEQAVAEALLNKKGLCILSDGADNPGGGATGDDVTVLRALLDAGARNSSVGVIADPESVHMAIAAGVGNIVELNLGGKLSSKNSEPISGKFYVKTISDGNFIYKFPLFRNLPGKMGLTVVLVLSEIEIIVTEKRIQVSDAEIFRIMGIEPRDRKIIVVKSAVHFRATFEKIAKGGIWEIDSGGLSSANLNNYSFKNLLRPIFPLDKNTDYYEI